MGRLERIIGAENQACWPLGFLDSVGPRSPDEAVSGKRFGVGLVRFVSARGGNHGNAFGSGECGEAGQVGTDRLGSFDKEGTIGIEKVALGVHIDENTSERRHW